MVLFRRELFFLAPSSKCLHTSWVGLQVHGPFQVRTGIIFSSSVFLLALISTAGVEAAMTPRLICHSGRRAAGLQVKSSLG